MGKELSEMSLEELWELFPISLVPHDDGWERNYDEIEALLKSVSSGYPIERISHIGSTAIARIWAKDIVDVLVEVSRDSDIEDTAKAIDRADPFGCRQTRTGYRSTADIRKTDLLKKSFTYTFAISETMTNCILGTS